MVQDQGFAIYVETSQNFSAHQAILKVAEGLLMPAAGSVARGAATGPAARNIG